MSNIIQLRYINSTMLKSQYHKDKIKEILTKLKPTSIVEEWVNNLSKTTIYLAIRA